MSVRRPETEGRMARILIIEDDSGIAFGLKNDLAFEGYDVEVARDGVTGAVRARSGAFDLVLSTSCCRERTATLSVASCARRASERRC
jgi:DNA-binding NtrC family response regulator